MQHDQEYLQSLLFEKIAGTISEKDDELVCHELAVNEQLQAVWKDILAKLDKGGNGGFADRLNGQEAWQLAQHRLEPFEAELAAQQPLYIRFTRQIAIAATLLLVLAAGVYFHLKPERLTADNVSLSKKSSNSVQLMLANGNVVNMGGKPINVTTGGVHLMSNSSGMNYKALVPSRNEWTTLIVPSTKDYQITLSDGSKVWLNSRSSIRFPLAFDTGKREVFIEGEAYFEVVHQPKRPFVVHTPSTDIQVLGTSFNVNTYSHDSVQTSLVKGSVKNYAGGRTVYLKPGMQSVFNNRTGFITRQFDEGDVLSWMNGVYYFHGEELKQIADVLERWYNIEVVFPEKEHETYRLTGFIRKDQPIQRFISNLEGTSGIKSRISGNKLVILN